MKKLIFSLVLLCVLTIVSCEKEELTTNEEIEFNAIDGEELYLQGEEDDD